MLCLYTHVNGCSLIELTGLTHKHNVSLSKLTFSYLLRRQLKYVDNKKYETMPGEELQIPLH